MNYELTALQKAVHTSQVLANDIKLYVHNRTGLDIVEVGILESIGNDAHLEGILRGAAYRQTDTIHGYTTLIYSKIAV